MSERDIKLIYKHEKRQVWTSKEIKDIHVTKKPIGLKWVFLVK